MCDPLQTMSVSLICQALEIQRGQEKGKNMYGVLFSRYFNFCLIYFLQHSYEDRRYCINFKDEESIA